MKVVLAFDKFKGSATASQLNDAACEALSSLDGVEVACVPVADGGDGTAAVLAANRAGEWMTMQVPAPLMRLSPVQAGYFLCDDGTALIEVASASDLTHIPPGEGDVMASTTLGTGLQMRDAMERGSRHIILGLGGSATCDAGMGIMCALGAEFLDKAGKHLFPCGASLAQIATIDVAGVPREVKACRFTLLADVNNPLCGKLGTAAVFAPQKGATPQQVNQLEQGMRHLAILVGDDVAQRPGCGASGGVPALMMSLLNCELLPGAPFVMRHNGLADALDGADLVITGEGRLDGQTMMGKAPGCVIEMAAVRGIPVAVVCGTIAPDFVPGSAGIVRAVGVSDGMALHDALETEDTLMRVSTAVRQAVGDLL